MSMATKWSNWGFSFHRLGISGEFVEIGENLIIVDRVILFLMRELSGDAAGNLPGWWHGLCTPLGYSCHKYVSLCQFQEHISYLSFSSEVVSSEAPGLLCRRLDE